MRLEHLSIKNFGHFKDFDLSLGSKPLSIICGPNEAGKSTLTHFIKHLLFGMPKETKFQYYIDGQKRGGHAIACFDDGQSFKITSLQRKKNSEPQLEPLGSQTSIELSRDYNRLIEGIGKPLYQNLFASTLLDFQNTAKFLQTEEFNKFLSQFLIAKKDPVKIKEQLLLEASGHFAGNRSSRKLKRFAEQYRSLKKELRANELQPIEYQQTKKTYEKTIEKCQQIAGQIKNVRLKLSALSLRKQLNSEAGSICRLKKQIDEIALPPDFPQNGLSLMDKNSQETQSKETKHRECNQKIENLKNQIRQIPDYSRAIEFSHEIDLLLVVHEQTKARLEIKAGLEEEIKTTDTLIRKKMSTISSELNRDDLSEYYIPQEVLTQIEASFNAYQSIQEQIETLNIHKTKLEQEKRRKQATIDTLAKNMDDKGAVVETLRGGQIDHLQTCFRQISEYSKKMETFQSRKQAAYLASQRKDLGVNSLAELLSIALPCTSAIDSFIVIFSQSHQHIGALTKEIESIEIQILERRHNRSKNFNKVDHSIRLKLDKLRMQRDLYLERIGDREDIGSQFLDTIKKKLVELSKKVLECDSLAERHLEEVKTEATQKVLQQDIDFLESKLELLKSHLQHAKAQDAQNQESWQHTWSHLSIPPLQPAIMKGWCRDIESLRLIDQEHREFQVAYNCLKIELNEGLETLRAYTGEKDTPDFDQILSRARRDLRNREKEEGRLEQLKQDFEHLQVEDSALDAQLSQLDMALVKANNKLEKCLDKSLNSKFRLFFSRDNFFDIHSAMTILHDLETKSLNLREKQAHEHRFLAEFENQVESLCRKLHIVFSANIQHSLVSQISDLLKTARSNLLHYENFERELQFETKRQVEIAEDLVALRKERKVLLSFTPDQQESSFIGFAKDFEISKSLAEELRVYQASYRKQEDELNALTSSHEQAIDSSAPEDIDSEFKQTQRDLGLLEQELELAYLKRGEAKSHLDKFDGQSTVAAIKSQISGVEDDFSDSLHSYLSLKLSNEILDRAVAKFETQVFPNFLNRLGQLFSSLSLGEFNEVDNFDGQYRLRRKDGQFLAISALSSGTCEQLYLAIRLTAMERLLESSESLPFVFDDVLANCDPGRSVAAIKALAETAKRTQVIYLTCHPEFADLAREHISPEQVSILEFDGLKSRTSQ